VTKEGPERSRGGLAATTRALSAQGVDSYHARGYLFPLPVLSPNRAAATVGEIRAFEAAHPEMPKRTLRHGLFRFKPHLIFTWLDRIVHAPAILDAVEGIIGPDIVVWARCCSSRTRATGPTSGTRTRFASPGSSPRACFGVIRSARDTPRRPALLWEQAASVGT
jgi:hypothetical protein